MVSLVTCLYLIFMVNFDSTYRDLHLNILYWLIKNTFQARNFYVTIKQNKELNLDVKNGFKLLYLRCTLWLMEEDIVMIKKSQI